MLGEPAVVRGEFRQHTGFRGDTVFIDFVQLPTDTSKRRLVIAKALCTEQALSVCNAVQSFSKVLAE